jgi:CxxC-x17-CxxC domain-containing protein
MAGFRSGNSRGFGGNRSGRRPRRSGGGFGGGFSGGRSRERRFDDGDSEGFERRRPEMHEAICDKCGKNCEVPFRPTEGKPVLCSDCFNKSGGSIQRQRFSPRSNDSSSGISQEQYKEINKKLDKILGILETIEFEEVDEEDEEDTEEEGSVDNSKNDSEGEEKVGGSEEDKDEENSEDSSEEESEEESSD